MRLDVKRPLLFSMGLHNRAFKFVLVGKDYLLVERLQFLVQQICSECRLLVCARVQFFLRRLEDSPYDWLGS